MKICQAHWDELRKAIEERGLIHLVSKNATTVIDRTVSQLRGDSSNDSYDPLMAANFAIWGNAIDCYGLQLMVNDVCPLCLLDEHSKTCSVERCKHQTGSVWITFAADDQLNNARERGLIAQQS